MWLRAVRLRRRHLCQVRSGGLRHKGFGLLVSFAWASDFTFDQHGEFSSCFLQGQHHTSSSGCLGLLESALWVPGMYKALSTRAVLACSDVIWWLGLSCAACLTLWVLVSVGPAVSLVQPCVRSQALGRILGSGVQWGPLSPHSACCLLLGDRQDWISSGDWLPHVC